MFLGDDVTQAQHGGTFLDELAAESWGRRGRLREISAFLRPRSNHVGGWNARQHVVWDSMDVAWGPATAPKQRVLFQQSQEVQTISASNGWIFMGILSRISHRSLEFGVGREFRKVSLDDDVSQVQHGGHFFGSKLPGNGLQGIIYYADRLMREQEAYIWGFNPSRMPSHR